MACCASSIEDEICLVAVKDKAVSLGYYGTEARALQVLQNGTAELPIVVTRRFDGRTLGTDFEPFVDDGVYIFNTDEWTLLVEVVDGLPTSYKAERNPQSDPYSLDELNTLMGLEGGNGIEVE